MEPRPELELLDGILHRDTGEDEGLDPLLRPRLTRDEYNALRSHFNYLLYLDMSSQFLILTQPFTMAWLLRIGHLRLDQLLSLSLPPALHS
jgi:hypothetical protein